MCRSLFRDPCCSSRKVEMSDTENYLYRAGMNSSKVKNLKRKDKEHAGQRCELCGSGVHLDAHHSTVSSKQIEMEAFKRSGVSPKDRRVLFDHNDERHVIFKEACINIHLDGLDGVPVEFQILCSSCHRKVENEKEEKIGDVP